MPQSSIFGPFFTTIFLTFMVWAYMYVRRISFINKNEIKPEDLTSPGVLAEMSPPEVSNPSDNLKNLFEIPVLFYALVVYLYATSQVDATYVAEAWRFYLYLISALAAWFIAARALLGYLGS